MLPLLCSASSSKFFENISYTEPSSVSVTKGLQFLLLPQLLILKQFSVSLLKQSLLFWLGEAVLIYTGDGTTNPGLACPACSTHRAIDLLQMHIGSRQPNQQTKAKHEHKSFQNCLAKWGDVYYFLQDTDELVRLIVIFVPLGSGAGPQQNPHIMV